MNRIKSKAAHKWLFLLASFFCTVTVLSIFLQLLPEQFAGNDNSDFTFFYEPVAINLINGNGFMLPNGNPAIRFPCGYPLILAALYKLASIFRAPNYLIVRYFLNIMTGLSAVFIFIIASSNTSNFSGFISALVWATSPFTLWLSKQPNSEIPFITFLLLSVILFIEAIKSNGIQKYLTYACTGAICGVCMLIRPIAIGYWFILSLLIVFIDKTTNTSRRLICIALLCVCNLLVILPWEIDLYNKTGNFILLSDAGAVDLREGIIFGIKDKDYRNAIEVPKDVHTVMEHLYSQTSSDHSIFSIVVAITKEINKNPVAVAKLFLIKAVRSWYGTDAGRFERLGGVIQLVYVLLFIISTVIAIKSHPFEHQLIIISWLILGYFWFMTMLVVPVLRYMIPGISMLFVLPSYLSELLAAKSGFLKTVGR